MIEDALSAGGILKSLIISSSIESPEEYLDDLSREYGSSHGLKDTETYLLDNELFHKISETENGRSVIGEFEKPGIKLTDALENSLEKRNKNIIVLDRIQDPGNIGTIIRTADAAGFSGIVAIKGTVDAFSPKVVRAAAGSIMRVPIEYVDGEEYALELIEKSGLRPVTTSMEAEVEYWDEDLTGGVAVIIGNEGSGVSDNLRSMIATKIRIPMEGKIESLNAGVAASLVIYEVRRQNGGLKK